MIPLSETMPSKRSFLFFFLLFFFFFVFRLPSHSDCGGWGVGWDERCVREGDCASQNLLCQGLRKRKLDVCGPKNPRFGSMLKQASNEPEEKPMRPTQNPPEDIAKSRRRWGISWKREVTMCVVLDTGSTAGQEATINQTLRRLSPKDPKEADLARVYAVHRAWGHIC